MISLALEWQFAQNWQLVSGIRFDDYTDFGSTINPRAALIWATTDSITTKFLYGRAFRAPSLNELYVANNPVTAGNRELEAENIDTFEAALSHQLSAQFVYGINLFYYEIDDLITAVPVTGPISQEYRNSGERKGHGGELELTYSPLDEVNLSANYAYQKSTDERNGDDVGEAPNHQLYGRLDWEVTTHWSFITQVNWVGEQKRVASDSRPPVDDYTTVDITLRAVDLWPDWAFSVVVRNLLDQDVRDPSPYADPVPEIPNDFPMPRRHFMAELQYQF